MTMPAGEEASGWLGLAHRLLNWLDHPWKLLAAMLLSVTLLGGIIIWENRIQIVTVIVPEPASTVRYERAPGVLADLLRATEADFVALYRLDLERNRRRLHLAMGRQGQRIEVEGTSQPFIRATNGQAAIVLPHLLMEQVPCLPFNDRTEADIRLLAVANGLTFYCVGGVQSGLGALRGMIVVGFARAPADPNTTVAMLRIAAQELIGAPRP